LICDFAEYYHIYDYKVLPLEYVSTLFFGLRAESRSKLSLTKQRLPADVLLLAFIADALNTLVWFQSEDGQKGRNRPKSIYDVLTGANGKVTDENVLSFSSAEEFEKERMERIKENGN
jgi:hypothetical protein